MTDKAFYHALLAAFPFKPTAEQHLLIKELAKFIINPSESRVFSLKGFAGTGKTTLISALVKLMKSQRMSVQLLAPTGRAAKVISEYAQQKAYTIHKHIYYPKTEGASVRFSLKTNKETRTLYLVDEASMISTSPTGESLSLLDDLMEYTLSGKGSRLILIGDTAQLPPVGEEESPALCPEHLQHLLMGEEVPSFTLTQVMRQSAQSGILHNATRLREALLGNLSPTDALLEIAPYTDIVSLSGGEVQEKLEDAYQLYGTEQTAFIVRTNKRARQYNEQIRKVILGRSAALSVGDLLMVVKNNYHWLGEESEAGFIANGDTIEVRQIISKEQKYGFHFAHAKVQLVDYPDAPEITVCLCLDVLSSDAPALSYEQNNHLYQELYKEYSNKPAYKRYQSIKANPYFNALQVKYSYAITCHKSQGGQWEVVFIEKPYLPQGINTEYLRWLYTAITRAKKKVYLLGF